VTRGQLPQRAGSLGLNGGGTAAAVPPIRPETSVIQLYKNQTVHIFTAHLQQGPTDQPFAFEYCTIGLSAISVLL